MKNAQRRFKVFDDVFVYFHDCDNSMAEAICFLAARLKLLCDTINVDFDWDTLPEKTKKKADKQPPTAA